MPNAFHTQLFHKVLRIAAGPDLPHYLVTRPILEAVQARLDTVPMQEWNDRFGKARPGTMLCDFMKNLLSDDDLQRIRDYRDAYHQKTDDLVEVLNLIARQMQDVSMLAKTLSQEQPPRPESCARDRLVNASLLLKVLMASALTTPTSTLKPVMDKLSSSEPWQIAVSMTKHPIRLPQWTPHNTFTLCKTLQTFADARNFFTDLRMECENPDAPRVTSNKFIHYADCSGFGPQKLWEEFRTNFPLTFQSGKPVTARAIAESDAGLLKRVLATMQEAAEAQVKLLNSYTLRLALGEKLTLPSAFRTDFTQEETGLSGPRR